ncbi:MAG: hypothetical protein WAM82_19285 [Thermoanaerobaculia bacterium]
MKKVRFRELPPVGPVPGPWKEESVSEILLRAPYFPARDILPSFEPMNDLLRAGRIDCGMSGGAQWKPLAITKADYADLVRELRDRRPTLRVLEAPPWVKTMADWDLFLDEALDGIPARLQRPYVERINAVRAMLFAAMARKDQDAIARYTNEEVILQIERQEAIEKLRQRKTTG